MLPPLTDTSHRPVPGVLDIAGFIDEQPVGRGQVRLLLTCAAVLFVDGFDMQASATLPRP